MFQWNEREWRSAHPQCTHCSFTYYLTKHKFDHLKLKINTETSSNIEIQEILVRKIKTLHFAQLILSCTECRTHSMHVLTLWRDLLTIVQTLVAEEEMDSRFDSEALLILKHLNLN